MGEKSQEVFMETKSIIRDICAGPCFRMCHEGLIIETVWPWVLNNKKIKRKQLSICYMIKEVFHLNEEKNMPFMPKSIPNGFSIFM